VPERNPYERRKLLRTWVEKAMPGDRPRTVMDEALPGFGLVVNPSGVKTYIVRYRPKGGGRAVNARTLTIGRHPALTPEEARDIAREKLLLVAQGKDPAEGGRARQTVAGVLDAYLDHLKGRPSWRTVEGDVRLHLKPAIGHLLVRELTPDRVEETAARIRERGHETTAGRIVRTLRAALRKAKIGDAAIKGVVASGWRERQRTATADELRRFFLACGELLRTREVWPWAVWMFELVVLTGARVGEIRTARWADVDLERRLIVRTVHKTVGKTGRPRRIPLNAAALQVLGRVERVKGNPHLIPGKRAGQPLSVYDKPWKRLCEVAGIEGLWVYDLRRAIPSLGIGLGFSLEMIGKALGHEHADTTRGYTHLLPTDLHRVADAVGERFLEIAGPTLAPTPPGRGENT
jgi:integrase